MQDLSQVVVHSPFGALRGRVDGGVARFRRVPYAPAPVGPARFALPGEPPRWSGVRDACVPGSVAPQLPSRLDAVMGAYPAGMDEDCLHLDIWAPWQGTAAPAGPAPVLVFLHGGAFMTGGGSLDCYDGALLARRAGIVVVNVSYRLGLFGFLARPDFAPANLGLHDQRAALRWVSQAIAAFGGDAGNVTVSGQSAGAFSVAAMLADPACRGLFRRAILMSAPLGLALPRAADAPPTAEAMLRALGRDPADLEPLRTLPVADLLGALARVQQERMLPPSPVPGDVTPPFLPTVGEDGLARSPIDALSEGAGAWCDTLVGVTRDEYAAFAHGNPSFERFTPEQLRAEYRRLFGDGADEALARARAQLAPADPASVLSALRSDEVFAGPSAELAQAQAQHGARSYLYQFDWASPRAGLQACHCIDLPFLFGNLDTWQAAAPMLQGADAGELQDLSATFQGALCAFVRTGRPEGGSLPRWPGFGSNGACMHFGRRTQAGARC